MGLCRARPVLGTILIQIGVAVLFWIAPAVSVGSFGLERSWIVPVAIVIIGRWIYLIRCGLGLVPGILGGLSALAMYLWLNSVMLGTVTREMLASSSYTALWATAVVVCLIVFLRRSMWAPVNLIAEISYGMYLYHIPIAFALLYALVPTGGPWMAPVVLLSFAVTVLVSLASHHFVEKPVRNALRRRLRNRPQPAIVV